MNNIPSNNALNGRETKLSIATNLTIEADNQYVAVRIYKFYYGKKPFINGRTALKVRTFHLRNGPFGNLEMQHERDRIKK